MAYAPIAPIEYNAIATPYGRMAYAPNENPTLASPIAEPQRPTYKEDNVINNIPSVSLGELLTLERRPVKVLADQQYAEIGTYSFGRGIFHKTPRSGLEVGDKDLYLIREGDFILQITFAWEGAVGLASAAEDGMYGSVRFPTFRVDENRCIPSYLLNYFRTPAGREQLVKISPGSAGRNRVLSLKRIPEIMIPLPPLAEQRRIVARIEAIATKIDAARALRRQAAEEAGVLINASRAVLFEEAAKKGTVHLNSVATLERGRFSHRPRNDPRFFGGDHPWIQIAEIESSGKYIQNWSQTLNEEGLAISRKFTKGTLLLSIAATIGAVGILDFDCCVPDSIVAVIPKTGIESEYLYHYLGYLRSHLEQVAPQSAQKNINLEILSPLPIPLLSQFEQRRIVAHLDALQTKVDAMNTQRTAAAAELNALLPALLDRAFRGQL